MIIMIACGPASYGFEIMKNLIKIKDKLKDSRSAIIFTEQISGFGSLQNSLENIVAIYKNTRVLPFLKHDTLFSRRLSNKKVELIQNIYSNKKINYFCQSLSVIASIIQISGKGSSKLRMSADLWLYIEQLSNLPKQSLGGDGSDQVRFFMNGLTAISHVSNEKTRQNILWTISLQACNAYFVSGVTKLFGTAWRDNTALIGVMRTRNYGNERLWKFLKKYPKISKFIEVNTLALETFYFLALLGNKKLTNLLVTSVLSLHLGIGLIMGLNRFIPAFYSLQPAVLYCSLLKKEKNGLLNLYIGLILGAFILSGVYRIKKEIKSQKIVRGEIAKLKTESQINYEIFRSNKMTNYLMVCENSLSAVKEYWHTLVNEMKDSCDILIYDRPGQGLSTSSHKGTFEYYSEEINELIKKNIKESQELILCGHSLGGYLLTDKLDSEIRSDAKAIILLDPSNTENIRDNFSDFFSKKDAFNQNMSIYAYTAKLGFGWMFQKEIWKEAAKNKEISNYLSNIYRLPKIWETSKKEWNEYIDFAFSQKPRGNFYHPNSLLLISEQTKERNESYLDSLREKYGINAKYYIVDNTTHTGILTDKDSAKFVSKVIKEYIERL